jgi:hypothetical protein
MSNRQVIVELTPRQQEFAAALLSGKYRYLLFGGAIRGGKSYVAIALLFLLCRVFPGSRWCLARKDLPTLKRNTLPTLEKLRPSSFADEVNKQNWTIDCVNGSQIVLFTESSDKDPELNRWRGLEVNGFVLEECNEFREAAFNKAIERAGSWTTPGKRQPPPLVIMTCNPARNWVKRLFYDPHKLGKLEPPFFYLPARVTDNPHLTPEYLASLETMRTTSPAAYQTFVEGDWSAADEPDQLVHYDWCLAAMHSVEHIPGKRHLGVDPARYGDDLATIAHRDGNAITHIESWPETSISQVADYVAVRMADGPVDADCVKVDSVGLGAGVVDDLRKRGFGVVEVAGGAAAEPDEESAYTFANLRSQLHWRFREALRQGQVVLPDEPRLMEDLTSIKYAVTGDKHITVESKDQLKKRLGRSPDFSDAAIYAFTALASEPELAWSWA